MANELDQLNLTQAGTLPPELYAQQQQLNRQQQMASMLMQQGTQQPQGQMVSGRYVPTSFWQNLQPIANMLTGAYLAKSGDTRAAELAQQLRTGRNAAEESIINKMQGTAPQATEMAGPYGQGVGKGGANVPMPVSVQPGTAPDLTGALREIRTNPYNAGKEYLPTLLEQLHPKVPSAITEFKYAKEHPEFAQYTFQKARASAPSVINQVGASLAEQAGKMFKESKDNAMVGYNSITSADKILNSTNTAITGPLANARLTGMQVADTLGITGKGEKEKIASTRQILQETGKLALAAPPKGQGQVSNYERDLYQRASSGDIDFTPIELNLIAKRAIEAGQYQIEQHNQLLNNASELGPDAAKLSKLYRITPPQPTQLATPPAQPPTSNKVKFLGFE